MTRPSVPTLAVLLPLLSACAVGGATDAGSTPGDAGARRDSGVVIDRDAGPRPDGGATADAGPRRDGGVTLTDAGPPDAGSLPDAGGGTVSPACAAAIASIRNAFEADATGWTSGVMDGVSIPSWPLDPWEYGEPSGSQPSCFEGSLCLGTDMDQNYAQCGRAELRSPSMDLTACSTDSLALVIDHSYDFWSGAYGGSTWYDGGLIELSINGGSSWIAVDPVVYPGTIRINPDRGISYECSSPTSFYVHGRPGFVGSSGGWERLIVPLPAEVLGESSVMVRFAWASGVSSSTTNASVSRSSTAPGWFIDDFRIEPR